MKFPEDMQDIKPVSSLLPSVRFDTFQALELSAKYLQRVVVSWCSLRADFYRRKTRRLRAGLSWRIMSKVLFWKQASNRCSNCKLISPATRIDVSIIYFSQEKHFLVVFVLPIASPCCWLRSILSIQKLKRENKTTVAAFKQFPALSVGCVNCSELSLVQLIAELSRAKRASGAPWVIKFGKLSIR